jgi:tRNA G46 methylase TrmB
MLPTRNDILETDSNNNNNHFNGKHDNKPSDHSKRQKLEWKNVFPNYNELHGDEIWFEIGFGLGDNLLCLSALDQASNNTKCQTYYIGAEMHKGGVGTICTRIQSSIENQQFWTDYTLFDPSSSFRRNLDHTETRPSYNNVRIYMGDGTKLLPFIPDNSMSAVLVTFPDPFMGTNQSSFRLLQIDVLEQVRRILTCSSSILSVNSSEKESTDSIASSTKQLAGRLYLATDHFGYHEWSHKQVDAYNRMKSQSAPTCVSASDDLSPTNGNDMVQLAVESHGLFKLVEPTPDRSLWLPVISKYEQKALDEGRQTYLSCWEAR